jgi:hypothetical protein
MTALWPAPVASVASASVVERKTKIVISVRWLALECHIRHLNVAELIESAKGTQESRHVAPVWCARSGTKRGDLQRMTTLAFGREVLKFTVQRQALYRVTGTVEVRTEHLVALHKRSVVQAGGVHALNAKPSMVPNRG